MENTTKKAATKMIVNVGEINVSYKDISVSFEGEVEVVKAIAAAVAEKVAKFATQNQNQDK